MWDLLKKTDIQQAKQDIKLRRVEILRKHAEETRTLDSDQVELEILNHLIDIFTLKFKKPQILSPQPGSAAVVHDKVPAPVPVRPIVHEKTLAPAPIGHEPIVHEKTPPPAPVVPEKVSAKSVEVDHAHSPRSLGMTPVTPVKAADHVRGQKAHGSSPTMTCKEERFHLRDPRGTAARGARHNNQHKYPRTNFESFSRALARELALE
jgi:hypothetical protein